MLGANARLKPTLGAVSHCLKEAWNYNFDHFVRISKYNKFLRYQACLN